MEKNPQSWIPKSKNYLFNKFVSKVYNFHFKSEFLIGKVYNFAQKNIPKHVPLLQWSSAS